VWLELYPGNRHTVTCLRPAVLATESSLEFASPHLARVVWRMDGGAGSDAELLWLLQRGYHVMAKGISNRRAQALAKQVKRWDAYEDYWLGEVQPPIDYGRKIRCFVKWRIKKAQFCYSYYLSTLTLPSKGDFLSVYDARGAAEVEQFRNDKSGLSLAARRKRSFTGQQAYILLTDLAHNLLADFQYRALRNSRFDGYGFKRIIRDLLATPGRLVFDGGQLKRIELLSQMQYAQDLLTCLKQLDSSS
jgi:hypothetical protein